LIIDPKNYFKGKVLYIASPYSAVGVVDEELKKDIMKARFEEVTAIEAELTKLYQLTLLCPITTSHLFKEYQPDLGTSWDFWSQIDENLLRVVDALLLIKMAGWENSIGVKAELQLAVKHNKPVYEYNPIRKQFYVRINNALYSPR
jgi:hypothetical protein